MGGFWGYMVGPHMNRVTIYLGEGQVGGLRELTQCAFDTTLMCTLYAYMCIFDKGEC